jgi:UPF0755 protein
MTDKFKKILKILFVAVLIVGIVGSYFGMKYYHDFFKPNTVITGENAFLLYIPTGSDFERVMDSLKKNNILTDTASFRKAAEFKNYTKKIKPGRYEISGGTNNFDLINKLRSGQQKPVELTFNNIRTKAELASRISKQIEADSVSLLKILNNSEIASKYGFTNENFISMFLPDTYEFYWNTSSEKFTEKMSAEYKKFWNTDRLAKAREIGLSAAEVSVLASIVQAEQAAHNDEKPIIAGLYINRLRRNMLLQSDPTLVFALGDFSRQRILNSDKEIESPYNTYKYVGLPPGPINVPEISSIKAVLNYAKTDYLFMCAKEDFSGYHNFATNTRDHENNARKYQAALNKQKIWK